jgi:hypothetical protein
VINSNIDNNGKRKKKIRTKGNKILTLALQEVERMSITTMTATAMVDGGSTDDSSNNNCDSSKDAK